MAAPPPAYSEKGGEYPPPQNAPPGQPGYAPPPAQGYVAPQQPGYPPPAQGGYPTGPPPPPGSTVVVQPTNVVVGGVAQFSEFPTNMVCPSCHAQVTTSVDHVSGTLTWLAAGGLFIVGCWPCCLIPFCVDGCKDTVHRCPNCKNTLGVFKRI